MLALLIQKAVKLVLTTALRQKNVYQWVQDVEEGAVDVKKDFPVIQTSSAWLLMEILVKPNH